MSSLATQRFPFSFFKKQSLLKPSIRIVTLKNPIILSPRFSSFNIDLQGLSIRMIHCSKASNFSASNKHIESSPAPGIFIKGLPQSATEGSLWKEFSKFGEITDIKIMMDKTSNQTLGFGYVWFTNEEAVQSAVKEMNGEFFDGRFLFVAVAKPGFPRRNPRATPYKF